MNVLDNIESIRKEFPILNTTVNGNKLIYLDNAATSQTPNCVIESISNYYRNLNSNIHRGVHTLSQIATEKYEDTRKKFSNHFNARNSSEIIFTSGTTHSINLVSSGFTNLLDDKDEIIVSQLEHHSNIVPWQMLCEKTGAKMKVIPMNDIGELDLNVFSDLLSEKTNRLKDPHSSKNSNSNAFLLLTVFSSCFTRNPNNSKTLPLTLLFSIERELAKLNFLNKDLF